MDKEELAFKKHAQTRSNVHTKRKHESWLGVMMRFRNRDDDNLNSKMKGVDTIDIWLFDLDMPYLNLVLCLEKKKNFKVH